VKLYGGPGNCLFGKHQNQYLEEVSEENYFFALSKYEKEIIELIESDKLKIYPTFRKNEVLGFLKEGLKDISISRSNTRAKNWGVSVPNDETQKMYVWFDALNIYASGVGFGSDEEKYAKWWPADLHVIGKGIIRFHAIYWPAFLLSAKLPLPKALFVHGYFTVEGQKMSKTLGNVVDPMELIQKYGVDVLRYYFLSEMSPFSDGDFSIKRLEEIYNSELANGLGNLVSRVAKLCETSGFKETSSPKNIHLIDIADKYKQTLEEYKLNEAIALVKAKITRLDKYINDEKPWELLKISSNHKGRELNLILAHAVDQILEIAILLEPFIPTTSKKIRDQFEKQEIKADKPLFPRLS
jgi:methionyl-tRNA synthetase